jgi:peptide/nickel transport system substrate-binding protein
VSNIFGVVAEKWEISDDGKTFTFTIRPGMKFASGNPITADDAVYLAAAGHQTRQIAGLHPHPVRLFNADNVDAMIRKTGDMTFEFEMDKPYAPTLVLYCLTATIGFIVDKRSW